MCNWMQDLRPESADRPLCEESSDFLTESAVQLFTGTTALPTDVILKLGEDELPAHRCLLAKGSDVFQAMFQASSASLQQAAV